ncbi:MAG: hypothetical protein FJW23_14770 [Acidimicrobiia bacterium]|nr:hypothetical protein [Acidimicrobiia bacterium]
MAMHLNSRWIGRRVYEYFAVNVAPLLGWRDPILVYQMGKVGSSSIRNSLFRCEDPRTRLVLMSHEFYPIRKRDLSRIRIEPEYRDHVIREIEHSRRVFRQVSARRRRGWRIRETFYTQRIYQAYVKPGHRLRVISPVRDPVACNISMFFEQFDQYAGAPLQESPLDIDSMIDIFIERFMHWRPLTWFDAELKTTLGLDVFQHPFPREQGFNTIAGSNVELLLLKSELDDTVKAGAIADFLGLDAFTMVRSNVSSDRSHARQYEEFKRRIRVPDWLLDDLYESKFARFFYTDEERARFRRRWSGETAPA